ncbi:MAG: DUF1631 family protein [Ramlibacter sp.]|jgi:hypothetical protein|nr:DUF1631 family protein [Ramlibacter sp.]
MKEGLTKRLGVADDAGASAPSLRECLDAVLRLSEHLIDSVIDGLAVSAARSQTLASSAENKPVLKAAIEHIVQHKQSVRSSFLSYLRVAMFEGVGHSSNGAGDMLLRFDQLQTYEDGQLDESIEIARAQQEVEMAAGDELPAVDALMSTLLGWITIHAQINPMRPEVFVRALRECLLDQVPDTSMRDALITPAAGRMGVGLRTLYRQTCDWLRSHGVEPAGHTAPVVPSPAVAAKAPPASSVARTLLTLDKLRRLLSGELDGDTSRGPQDFLHTVPASLQALQDMKQVEAMVQRLAQRAKDPAAPKPPARKPGDNKQLGKQLGEEVTRLMLDNLIQDERLLPRVRQMLQTLEGVLLTLAKADQRFFSDKQHPARVFLDRVTHRSLAFTTERDEGFLKFIKAVEKAIAALLEYAGEGPPPFGPVVQKLDAYWAREDAAARQQREEATRALVHAEQRNLLAQRLAQDLRAKVEGTETPAEVGEFVVGPWAQVLAEFELRGAAGGTDPDGLLTLADDLIWSVQPKVAKRNRARLVDLVPSLLVRLRQGLQLIDFPADLVNRFFDQLIAVHERALEESRPPPAQPGATPESEAEAAPTLSGVTEEEAGFWLAGREATEAGYLDADSVLPIDVTGNEEAVDAATQRSVAAQPLATGTWVELMLDGKWVRVQLTWASPHRTLFMFTSRGGLAHSMSRRTMEKLRVQGLIRVISDGHVVDNALDAVAQMALRNTLDEAGGKKSGGN